jgi:hypothetical protein
MAPTNRLIEARRAQLRAEDEADKRSDAKTSTDVEGLRPQTARPKARPKAKA